MKKLIYLIAMIAFLSTLTVCGIEVSDDDEFTKKAVNGKKNPFYSEAYIMTDKTKDNRFAILRNVIKEDAKAAEEEEKKGREEEKDTTCEKEEERREKGKKETESKQGKLFANDDDKEEKQIMPEFKPKAGVWQINLEDAEKDSQNDKSKLEELILNKTPLLVHRNGGKKRGSYPFKLVRYGRSKFIRAAFLDHLKQWQITKITGNIITINNPHVGKKISAYKDIPVKTELYFEVYPDYVSIIGGWKSEQNVVMVLSRKLHEKTRKVKSTKHLTMINFLTGDWVMGVLHETKPE